MSTVKTCNKYTINPLIFHQTKFNYLSKVKNDASSILQTVEFIPLLIHERFVETQIFGD